MNGHWVARPVSVWLLAACAATGLAQPSQRTLAQQVASPDVEVSARGVVASAKLEPAQVGPELREALFAALRREADAGHARYVRIKRGEPPPELSNPELIGAIARVVVALHDPQAIPALASAMFIGPIIPRELAQYGDAGADAVITAMSAPDAFTVTTQIDGLVALRMLAELRGTHPLSPANVSRIRAIAAANLAPGAALDHLGVALGRSIDLAIALGDAELRRVVESMAMSRAEVVARGTADDAQVARIQKQAADRLASVAPLPRP